MERKAPTVYDVAERAGVSIATVSRAFSKPESVREETRERVLEAVRTLGYVPSASARGLAGNRTGVFGLLLPELDDAPQADTELPREGPVEFLDDRVGELSPPSLHLYFDELLLGFETAAWRSGRSLLVSAGRGRSREMVMSDIAGRVDGLAVVSRSLPDSLISWTARRVPIVVVAGDVPGARADHVSVDNEGGMAALTCHVLSVKPPGPVLYLDGPPRSPDSDARRQGFLSAASSAQTIVRTADFSRDGGREATREVLRRERPGAVIAANDQSALGALDALSEARVSVPADCVVTGFDGIDVGRYSSPSLTTVRQPMTALGAAAIGLLQRRIADTDAAPEAVRLPVQVLLRDSCPAA